MIDTPQDLAVALGPIAGAAVDAETAARIDAGARRMVARAQLAIEEVAPDVEGFGAAGVDTERSTGSR